MPVSVKIFSEVALNGDRRLKLQRVGTTSVSEDRKKNTLLRALPSIDALLAQPSLAQMLSEHPRARKVAALRMAVERVRERLLQGEERGFQEEDVRAALHQLITPRLRPVLNATGVVLHTNLGRAPLAQSAAQRVLAVATTYSNLEYDLDEGERGSRYRPVVGLLTELTGAQAALAVNNNAAAVLIALSALAQGRDVIISRGELVEIGGGFRIPDVMRQSGARLVEVGTTNRTRISDYERALTGETALLLKVHKSNFAQIGFTEEVTRGELAALGRARGVPVFEDLGSGAFTALAGEGLDQEPTVMTSVSAGIDLVSFSGDKLLGGPQAGILVGRRDLIERIERHPLNRAVRVDKMTVAALEATLELYRDGRLEEIPAHRLLSQKPEDLKVRADALQSMLTAAGVQSRVERTTGQVGGGALPLANPVSYACVLASSLPMELQRSLRSAEPPLIARVADEQVLLDVRCLRDEDLAVVADIVKSKT
jgi:L-seryl-tRNA(Ser) seleniumtransferase